MSHDLGDLFRFEPFHPVGVILRTNASRRTDLDERVEDAFDREHALPTGTRSSRQSWRSARPLPPVIWASQTWTECIFSPGIDLSRSKSGPPRMKCLKSNMIPPFGALTSRTISHADRRSFRPQIGINSRSTRRPRSPARRHRSAKSSVISAIETAPAEPVQMAENDSAPSSTAMSRNVDVSKSRKGRNISGILSARQAPVQRAVGSRWAKRTPLSDAIARRSEILFPDAFHSRKSRGVTVRISQLHRRAVRIWSAIGR